MSRAEFYDLDVPASNTGGPDEDGYGAPQKAKHLRTISVQLDGNFGGSTVSVVVRLSADMSFVPIETLTAGDLVAVAHVVEELAIRTESGDASAVTARLSGELRSCEG